MMSIGQFCFVFFILKLCAPKGKERKKLRKDLHDPYLQGLCNKNMQIP